jgi:hypothetical protein
VVRVGPRLGALIGLISVNVWCRSGALIEPFDPSGASPHQ